VALRRRARHNLSHLPVVLAGDFNGNELDPVYSEVMKWGYQSAAKVVLGRELLVTHMTHNAMAVAVDFIFFRCRLGAAVVKGPSVHAANRGCARPRCVLVLSSNGSDGGRPRHQLVPTQFALIPRHLPDAVRRQQGPGCRTCQSCSPAWPFALPCAATVQAWPAAIDYSVSDHRMVLATFELV